MTFPSSLTAGDSARWRDGPYTLDGVRYDSGATTLTYHLRGDGAPLDVVGQADGVGWVFALTPTQAAQIGAGTWWWSAVLTATGFQRTAARGQVQVSPNLAQMPAVFDGRSRAVRDLDAVEAAISARTTGGAVLKYTIGSRNLEKEPIAALLTLRSALLIQVRNEQSAHSLANGQGNPRILHARFR